jgi:hypothetical protein
MQCAVLTLGRRADGICVLHKEQMRLITAGAVHDNNLGQVALQFISTQCAVFMLGRCEQMGCVLHSEQMCLVTAGGLVRLPCDKHQHKCTVLMLAFEQMGCALRLEQMRRVTAGAVHDHNPGQVALRYELMQRLVLMLGRFEQMGYVCDWGRCALSLPVLSMTTILVRLPCDIQQCSTRCLCWDMCFAFTANAPCHCRCCP